MTTDLELLAESNREKARRTIDLVVASLSEYRPFNPAATYTPKDLEPYDALADRFVRVRWPLLPRWGSQEPDQGNQARLVQNPCQQPPLSRQLAAGDVLGAWQHPDAALAPTGAGQYRTGQYK